MKQLDIRHTEEVKRCSLFQLHRVTTESGERFLLKSSVAPTHSANDDGLIKHEFGLLSQLASERVARPLWLTHVGDRQRACYRDFAGQPLGSTPGKRLAADEQERLSTALCASFDALHRAEILVLGISPRSFLLAPDGALLLVDAPFATRSAQAPERAEDEWILSPFLPYAAPESLRRRRAHPIDLRADLYALGALLYELFGGRPPFDSADPGELIHAHMARQPAPLHQLASGIAPVVSAAIMRLLAKNPGDRPASTREFLDACGWSAPFVRPERNVALPGERREQPDWATGFYGREGVLNSLREALDESDRACLAIVRGEPGSGKTSLLQELERTASGVVSCRGKFTRGGASQPLSGWASLARQLAQTALSVSATAFEVLRERLKLGLGASAPVLVSLVEEWDPMLRCGGRASEHFDGGLNRTAVALQRLLKCHADPAVPVWVFLEDLQWADLSSLRILELVLGLPGFPNLRVIASLRAADPDEDNGSLDELRENLRRSGVPIHTFDLEGWQAAELNAFVRDSFGSDLEASDDLLRSVMEQTRGNPFFAREFLAALVHDGALTNDRGRWRWQREACARMQLPDSLLELLMIRVHGLPAATKALLAKAACIGERVKGSHLALASALDAGTVSELMSEATWAGLIVQHSESPESGPTIYAFAHERVLEAALALLSDDERATVSIELFRALSTRSAAHDALPASTLANLFNAGNERVRDDQERIAGVHLNKAVGCAATGQGAYYQALHYLEQALALLARGEDSWRAHPVLTRTVHEHAAEVALLCNHFERCQALCAELLLHAGEPSENTAAYEFLIRALTGQKRFGDAIDASLRALRALKVGFPRKPSMVHVVLGYLATKRRLLRLGMERLRSLPVRQDTRTASASRIMQSTYPAANFHQPTLFPLIAYRQLEHCISHGNDDYATLAYNGFAMVLAGLGEVERALDLGAKSFELPKNALSDKLLCRALFVHYSFVVPWQRPVRETLPQLARAVLAALEHGDFEYVGYAMTMRALGQLHGGEALADLIVEFEQNLTQLTALAQERCVLMQRIVCEAVHELHAGSRQGLLSGPFYQCDEGLLQCKDPLDNTLVFHHYLAKLCVAVYGGDPRAAWQAIEDSRPHVEKGTFASYLLAPFLFYEAFAVIARATRQPSTIASARRRLRKIRKRLKGWAERCPANFRAKLLLVEAELLRLRGRGDAAARIYEQAIDDARAQGHLHEAGLIHERAADLWLSHGSPRRASQHLRDARAAYLQWGAVAVAQRLTRDHPQHFALLETRESSSSSVPPSLDYRALIKSSQAISGEILLPKLLERLLRTIMEHTDAQRGVLLLERRGELVVEAEADVDVPLVQLISDETVDTTERLCPTIVRYAARVEKAVVLDEATSDEAFGRDSYVRLRQPRSVLCAPILYQTKLLGLIYLENNRVSHVFTRDRLEMVGLLGGQAAISIANARFHSLQLEAQQARISPHFLFNALSSIAELATIDGSRAETAIVKLAHLYRYILASSTTELVSLEQELAIVRDYLALEKLRFGSKLEFSVTDEGPINEVRLPGLLIQPLVENSIRHAVAPKLSDGRVWVHARANGGRCTIVVQDDGDGSKHATSGAGFGLRSVQQRLELVYGDSYSLAISQRGGYRVELEVPQGTSGRARSLAPRMLVGFTTEVERSDQSHPPT